MCIILTTVDNLPDMVMKMLESVAGKLLKCTLYAQNMLVGK